MPIPAITTYFYLTIDATLLVNKNTTDLSVLTKNDKTFPTIPTGTKIG